jgi:outer membrane protein assembly factor BamD (BamD/ComL family)
MKKFIIGVLAMSVLACGETEYNEQQEGSDTIEVDYDAYKKECEDLEADILASETPNDSLLKVAINKFQGFANYFPEDPEAADYLLKSSDFSMATGQPEKSVKILDRIIDNYPDYGRMEDVMYVKASHIDLNLRDTTWAKQAYQEFIDKYPESELVSDAQIRIENIALSIEELAEKFMQELEEQPQ